MNNVLINYSRKRTTECCRQPNAGKPATAGGRVARSLTEIEIVGGIAGLKCPITGTTVIDGANGFDGDAEQSPHLRFFVDFAGDAWAANPAELPVEQREYQSAITAILSNSDGEDDQGTLLAQCAAILPKSTLLLELLDPPQGSFQGAICYACFELGVPAAAATIRLSAI